MPLSKILSTTADWDAGIPASGDNLFDTSGNTLKLKQAANINLNLDFDVYTGGPTTYGWTGWTKTSAAWANPKPGSTGGVTGHSNYVYIRDNADGVYGDAGGDISGSIKVFRASDNVEIVSQALQYMADGDGIGDTGWVGSLIGEVALTSVVGVNCYIRVTGQVGTASSHTPNICTLTSSTFRYDEGDITIYSRAAKIDDGYGGYYKYFYFDDIQMEVVCPTTYNFGQTPAAYTNLTGNATIFPAGQSIVISVRTSADGTSWSSWTALSAVTSNGNFTRDISAITPEQYLQWKTSNLCSGGIDAVSIGATWESAVQDLRFEPTFWRSFVASDTPNSQTIVYQFDTSADGITWDGPETLTSGVAPTNPTSQYFKYLITLNTTNYTQIPVLTSLTLGYIIPVRWKEVFPGNSGYSRGPIGIDNDGSNLVSCIDNKRMWVSSDYGVNWTETRPNGDYEGSGWQGLAINSDGSKMIVLYTPGSYKVFTTSDGGTNWVERTTGLPATPNTTKPFNGVASSTNGNKLLITTFTDYIYTSSDSGATWTKRDPKGSTLVCHGCGVSDDGVVMMFGEGSPSVGKMWISTNSGANWTESQPLGAVGYYWNMFAANSDGSRLFVGGGGASGRLFQSSDSGANWTEVKPLGSTTAYWTGVQMSSDGTILQTATFADNYSYISYDSGSNWITTRPSSSPATPTNVISSKNGDQLFGSFGVKNYIGVYTTSDLSRFAGVSASDISKISSVDLNNIYKVMGVLR